MWTHNKSLPLSFPNTMNFCRAGKKSIESKFKHLSSVERSRLTRRKESLNWRRWSCVKSKRARESRGDKTGVEVQYFPRAYRPVLVSRRRSRLTGLAAARYTMKYLNGPHTDATYLVRVIPALISLVLGATCLQLMGFDVVSPQEKQILALLSYWFLRECNLLGKYPLCLHYSQSVLNNCLPFSCLLLIAVFITLTTRIF